MLGDKAAAAAADRLIGIVIDLAPGDCRDGIVEELDQRPDEARLRLAALTEQHHVLPREDGILDLRDDRIVVSADAAEQLLVVGELANQVAAQLGPDGQDAVFRTTQLTDGGRGLGHRIPRLHRGGESTAAPRQRGVRPLIDRVAGGGDKTAGKLLLLTEVEMDERREHERVGPSLAPEWFAIAV